MMLNRIWLNLFKLPEILIQKNLAKAPTGDDAIVFTTVGYRAPGIDQRQVIARSKGSLELVKQTLAESHKGLVESGRLHTLATIMWEPSKKIEIL